MRRLLFAVLMGLTLSAHVGCFLPIYSGEPLRRTRQLIFTSEDFRLFLDEWERAWMLDMPSHLTPFRTHGGVI